MRTGSKSISISQKMLRIKVNKTTTKKLRIVLLVVALQRGIERIGRGGMSIRGHIDHLMRHWPRLVRLGRKRRYDNLRVSIILVISTSTIIIIIILVASRRVLMLVLVVGAVIVEVDIRAEIIVVVRVALHNAVLAAATWAIRGNGGR